MGVLVVCIPTQGVQKYVPVHHTGRYLGPELDILTGLASDNGSDIRLRDVHDTIGYLVASLVVHLFLLTVDFLNDPKDLQITMIQWQGLTQLRVDQLLYCFKVTASETQLFPDRFPDLLCALH